MFCQRHTLANCVFKFRIRAGLRWGVLKVQLFLVVHISSLAFKIIYIHINIFNLIHLIPMYVVRSQSNKVLIKIWYLFYI